MNKEKFLQNLENVCLDNVFMLYSNNTKDRFKHYVMACNTSELYSLITGDELFDKLEFMADYTDIYNEVSYYDNVYSNELLKNVLTFKDMILNYGKEVVKELSEPVNKWNNENRLCCKNLDKEDVYDLCNYFIEKEDINSNLLDKFIKNNRINMFNVDDGFFMPDLVSDNDFIILPNNKLDYYQITSILAHEAGHSDDYNNMTSCEKEIYSYLSVYKEVKSEKMQQEFNNFLIDDDICSPIGNYLKKSHLYTMYVYFNEAMSCFENIDNYKNINEYFNLDCTSSNLFPSVSYSVGFLTAFYLNYYKEKEKDFNTIHKNCYDVSLLSGIGLNEERVVKTLKKEINTIK